jgi:small subunit ribosomal protein S17
MTEENENIEETNEELSAEETPAEVTSDAVEEPTEEISETPAAPESVEEPEVEADAPAEEPAAEEAPEPVAEEPAAEPEAAVEEAPAEEPAAEAEDAPADEAPAEEPAAEAEAPAAPQSEPKKKPKRLPRALRPQKTRPSRAAAGERKPVVRLPKPDHERGRRQERRGVVVSSAMDKTIVVKVDVITSHQKYKKVIRRSVKFHAHDEQNAANIGDVVRIVETKPLSKTKHWRLAEIVEVAK